MRGKDVRKIQHGRNCEGWLLREYTSSRDEGRARARMGEGEKGKIMEGAVVGKERDSLVP